MAKKKIDPGYLLADKLQGGPPSAYMKKLRKEADAERKKSDKEYAKYIKERSARYKKEGIKE